MRIAILSCLLAAAAAAGTGGEEPLGPLPEMPRLDAQKQALGHRLFFEKRLSKDGKLDCSSCHEMTEAGAGARPGVHKDKDVLGRDAPMNSPSVFNAAYNFRQRWRADGGTLREVITKPLTNLMNDPPVKPRSGDAQRAAEDKAWAEVLSRLKDDPRYVEMFAKLYGDVTRAGVEDALATYMLALAPRGSRFDQFLSGRTDTISQDAKHGYALFKSYGCASCHQGRNVGGNMVAEFGVMLSDEEKRDLHVYELDASGKQQRYKVPSLRNVTRTPPYFHDGSKEKLEDAVTKMADVQLGRVLSADDVKDIVAFLGTLEGAPPEELLTNPFASQQPSAGAAR